MAEKRKKPRKQKEPVDAERPIDEGMMPPHLRYGDASPEDVASVLMRLRRPRPEDPQGEGPV